MLKTLLLAAALLSAQSPWPSPQASLENGLSLAVSPSAGYYYSLGDTVRFEVEAGGSGILKLEYKFTLDGAGKFDEGAREVAPGNITLAYAISQPGFLRLDLKLRSGADSVFAAEAVGYGPPLIRPTGVLPDDYLRFWNQGKAELLRVDPDPRVEHRPEFDYDGMTRFMLSLANVEGSRIYGWLTIPAGTGPFPAVVHIPGAPGGIDELHTSAQQYYAEAGIMVLSLNIHGVPIDLPDGQYREYNRRGLLESFPTQGADDKYRYFYRRVVLGSVRALDYLSSRPDVDTTRVAVAGESQGGGLSLLVTSLDRRVDALILHVPAMCDVFGPLHERPSGWPYLLRNGGEKALDTAGYFDGALAAELIKCPAVVGVSFLDVSCPPTTVYAMYNNLRGPKEIIPHPGVHHPGSFTDERSMELLDKLRTIFDIKD